MPYFRPTCAEVDLSNLAYNYSRIRARLSGQTKLMATVKADAYGHGLAPVAKKLVDCGADYLGVACLDEGILLRQSGIKAPVLVLGIALNSDINPLLQYNLIPTVSSRDFALALNRRAASLKRKVKVHLKVDTGMGRLGVMSEEAFTFAGEISRLKSLEIEGIFTHFAFADLDRKFTLGQVRLLRQLVLRLKACGINIPLVHAANSMGLLGYPQSHFNMVRPGLVLYGLSPKEGALGLKIKPVLSLKSRVVYTKRVPKGFGISYGHTYITPAETTIAVIPIGYGDGYPRRLSNCGPVLMRGRRFSVSGRVCMDQIMVDVGDSRVRTGDEAVLIGSQGRNRVSVEELARLCGTIPYEIVCGLGSRIPRVYK